MQPDMHLSIRAAVRLTSSLHHQCPRGDPAGGRDEDEEEEEDVSHPPDSLPLSLSLTVLLTHSPSNSVYLSICLFSIFLNLWRLFVCFAADVINKLWVFECQCLINASEETLFCMNQSDNSVTLNSSCQFY